MFESLIMESERQQNRSELPEFKQQIAAKNASTHSVYFRALVGCVLFTYVAFANAVPQISVQI